MVIVMLQRTRWSGGMLVQHTMTPWNGTEGSKPEPSLSEECEAMVHDMTGWITHRSRLRRMQPLSAASAGDGWNYCGNG